MKSGIKASFTPSDVASIIARFHAGESAIGIGRTLDCSHSPIRRVLKENGISTSKVHCRGRKNHTNTLGYVFVPYENGYRREHVVKAEKALGRKLNKGEVVHHVNGDKADNRNENLLICDKKYHQWLHARMGELYQLEHFKRV